MKPVEIADQIIHAAGKSPAAYGAKRLSESMEIPVATAEALISDVVKFRRERKVLKTEFIPLTDLVHRLLKKKAATVEELANALDRSPASIRKSIEELRGRGYNVNVKAGHAEMNGDVAPGNRCEIVHDIREYRFAEHRIGLVGDNHLGSRHERLDVLNALYDLFAAEGVTHVYNTGNWIEGESSFNRHDIKVFGMDGQIQYFLDNYPERKGIVTQLVAGDDHEGWYQKRESIEIGLHMENMARRAGREDLKYIGYLEADVEFRTPGGSRFMKVMHPGGGSAYALSYAAQKLVESFQGGEKPQLLAYGHYHKFDYNYAREIHCIGTGCTCDQSVFMRKCKIQAHVGGVMLTFNQAPDGTVNRVRVEWMPFYDRGAYIKARKFGLSQRVEAKKAA